MSGFASDIAFPRRIVLDDTDSRVKYSGSWSLDDIGSFNILGSLGPVYNNTMHGSSSNAASFSVTFEGEYIAVWGAKDTRKIRRTSSKDDLAMLPQWRCQVDGSTIQRVDYFKDVNHITNNLLCETGGLSTTTPHTLTVNVSIEDPQTQTFWMDKIEYSPGLDAESAGEVMKFDSSHVNVKYHNTSGYWFRDVGHSGELFNYTSTPGASLSFTFNGTSVSLYGFNEGDPIFSSPSISRYRIDDGEDTVFVSPGSRLSPYTGTFIDCLNEFLFQSPELEPGTHELIIMLAGGPTGKAQQSQGLSIDYFYVVASRGSDIKFKGITGGGATGPSGSSGSEGGSGMGRAIASGHSPPAGRIAGGVVGGLTALAVLGWLLSLVYTRLRRSRGLTRLTPYLYISSYMHRNPKSDTRIASGPASQGAALNLQDVERADVVERRHQDSGIRLTQAERIVIDVPPDYTVR
ncbi:hypothetical protein VNI00_013930 [Paramarasmius palmivorus]|uniref:Transmembrane protein n=1 Tax=Paramarasmius palmivorus TaxID=297713 RepID=A0AAW0BWD2_9AGAR